MTEWKDWKAGDKLVFVGAPDMTIVGSTGMVVNAVYVAAQIIPVAAGETLLIAGRLLRCNHATALVVVAEQPTEFTQAALFKRLEEQPEHRGMAILREIGAGEPARESDTPGDKYRQVKVPTAEEINRRRAEVGMPPLTFTTRRVLTAVERALGRSMGWWR